MALNLSADFFLLAPDILKCILILSRNLPKHSQINSTDPKSIAIPSHVELRNQSPGTCVWICRCVVCRPPSSAYKDDSRRGGGILPGWWWRVANTLSTNFDAYLLECSHSEKKTVLTPNNIDMSFDTWTTYHSSQTCYFIARTQNGQRPHHRQRL